MKNFLVVQHTYSEFLGTIEKQLEHRDIGFSYQRPFTGQALPGNALQCDALFLLGGAHPITDREACPWVDDELRLIEVFARAKRPVVGIGFGGQLIALHAGGTPQVEPRHDAYWTTAHATAQGREDPLAQAVDGRRVLVMANGRVTLPPQLAPVAIDEQGRWIAVRPTELSYGMLFRPELKPGMVEDMIMEEGRSTPDNIGELLEEARRLWEDMQQTTDRVVAALVTALDLMQERRKMPVFALNPVKSRE
ncbi:MAG: GMP synthase [Betaproteobacteria bacterium]|nr:GMP synthase [Betaproteobacteria bacterium]